MARRTSHHTESEPTTAACKRRSDIIVCAIRRFAETGYAETDLECIAHELGCAKGTLYLYFDSKKELFVAAVDQIMTELLSHTETPDIPDPLDHLEHAIAAYLRFFSVRPAYVELLMQERAQFRDRSEPTYFKYCRAHRQRLRLVYKELMKRGRIRTMPATVPFDFINSLLYGRIFTNYFSGKPGRVRAQAREILDIVYNGILTPSEAKVRARVRKGVGENAARSKRKSPNRKTENRRGPTGSSNTR